MSKTIQIRVDDQMKEQVDALFAGLGMDTSTAVRVFFTRALEEYGFPFPVQMRRPSQTLESAIRDVEEGRVHGPYKTVKDAMAAMLEDDDA